MQYMPKRASVSVSQFDLKCMIHIKNIQYYLRNIKLENIVQLQQKNLQLYI